MVGFTSKKGSHPPLADREGALLALGITEAIVGFLISSVSKYKDINDQKE
jgi:hypothetical protein